MEEKEKSIVKLKENVKDISSKFKAMSLMKQEKKIPSKDTVPPNHNPKKSSEERGQKKKDSESLRKKRIKCPFEDEGKCRFGRNCTKGHPTRVCSSHSKTGKCNIRSKCEYRHPQNVCFQWKKERYCYRGESCRFRHPDERPEKDFLGKSQPQMQNQHLIPSQWPPLIPTLPMYQNSLPMSQLMNLYPQWAQQPTKST